RIGSRKVRATPPSVARGALAGVSLDRLFGLYLVLAAFALALPYLVWGLRSVAQIIYALAETRWVAYYLLGYLTLTRRSKVTYFVLATLLEFLAGIGFFAEFRTVFFVCALVLFGLQYRITVRGGLLMATVCGVLFLFALVWTTIKDDYRNYLSRGTRQQVVLVSPAEQLTAFVT